MLIRFITLLFIFFTFAAPTFAQSDPRDLINGLGKANFKQAEELLGKIAGTGDARVVPMLEAFAEGDLYVRKSDGAVFVTKSAGANMTAIDPLTGETVGEEPKSAFTKIKVNNTLRRAIRSALGGLTLLSPDRSVRLQAAQQVLQSPSAENLDLVETALAREADAEVKSRMEEARAVSLLASDRSAEEKRAAIDTVVSLGGREAIGILMTVSSSIGDDLRPDLDQAIKKLEGGLLFWDMGQNVWYGISLGSVLLLAAIGLAITFGVMGIINMAHGEMVMIGAYSTFMVQEVIRSSYPALFAWSLAIALPVAFLVTGAIGLVIERGVIRFLYGRPLETLLATWGISLILQQAIRTIFGPTNQEVGNPSWMSGSFALGGLTITWNRLWIVLFSMTIFFALLALMKRSAFGLQMRAVTQNRRMASSMGIRTPWVDAFTFALGSGIAGIAGVALSQIDNVSPNLGQSYIIDSFMVVVFGGAGSLIGTIASAFGIAQAQSVLQFFMTSSMGKVSTLLVIVGILMMKPEGLFASKLRK